MAQGRPYQAYQNTQVQTSNQKQLIVMLYDGMNRFMNRAVKAIEGHDIETAHLNLHRTGQILLELLSTLREDKGGVIAANLKKIYVYCYEQIVIANLKKDAALVREVQGILANLGEGWKQIGRSRSAERKTAAIPAQIRITG
jgi:flagellar secretion chaperone FliS